MKGGGGLTYIRKFTVYYCKINTVVVSFPVLRPREILSIKMELKWEKLESDSCLSPREGQCSCVSGNSMFLFGGVLHTEDLIETNDLIRFSFGNVMFYYLCCLNLKKI